MTPGISIGRTSIPFKKAGGVNGAPSLLTAITFSETRIDLAWTNGSTNEDGISIEISTDGVNFVEITTTLAGVNVYADTGLTEATHYWYRVRAFKGGDYSDYSNMADDITIPAAPTALGATIISYTQIDLAWTDNSAGEDGYSIERSTDGINYVEIDTTIASINTYSDTTIVNITDYYYRVRAFLGIDYSDYSNVVFINEDDLWDAYWATHSPTNLVITLITGGNRISWTDNSDEENGFEIFVSIAGAAFVTLAIVGANITSYDDLADYGSAVVLYKVRAFIGVNYSDFSNESSELPITSVINDGHTVGWWKRLDTYGREQSAGVESIYWDLMYPYGTLGAEQSSGVILLYSVYKITACQTDFFYTGCLVGDTFICGTVKTCDANNKVQRYTGNHLTQPISANRPTNGVFNGTTHFMKTALFTFNQPIFLYIVLKQITWTKGHLIIDSGSLYQVQIYQKNTIGATPIINAYAGTQSGDNANLTLNVMGIIRALFNGANSLFRVNETTAITGNFGAANMGGITLSGRTDGVNPANIYFAEMIARNAADNASTQQTIYDYLKIENGL